MKKYLKSLFFMIVVIGFFVVGKNVKAIDFTSGTYYYNTAGFTDGFDIPANFSGNELQISDTPININNSSATYAYAIKSDWYYFQTTIQSGHSYLIHTRYQMYPYNVGGNYDMRLAGSRLKFTSVGSYIANYDSAVLVDNVSQNILYSDMTYDDCNGNYCYWTADTSFIASQNGSGFVLTHGASNLNNTNRFLFYWSPLRNSYVPEQIQFRTVYVTLIDQGATSSGGSNSNIDLGPLVQQQGQTNGFLQQIRDKINDFKNIFESKMDNIISHTQSILQSIGQGIGSVISNIYQFITNNVLGLDDIDDTLQDFVDSFEDNEVMGDIHDFLYSPIGLLNYLYDPTPGARCQDIGTNMFNKQITIPSGCFFWQRQDVQNFRTFWNWLFGGFLIFSLGFKYFKILHNAFDPTKDDLGGLNV